MTYNTKKLTDLEKFAIGGMLSEGKTPEEVKVELNRSPNSKAVDEVVEKWMATNVTTAIAEPTGPSEEEIMAWKPTASSVVNRLEKRGVPRDRAAHMVSRVMKQIDLSRVPNEEIILNYVSASEENFFSDFGGGVIASNAFVSELSEQSANIVSPNRPSKVSTFPAKK